MVFTHLLSAADIGPLRVPNRIVLAAMGTELAEEDGSCAAPIWDYYEARARGGAGLIVVETTAVSWPKGSSMPRQVALSDERYLPGLKQLAERIHRHGARAAIQLNHSGKVATVDTAQGRPQLVPSIPKFSRGDMFDALTPEEIAGFVKGARPPSYRVMDAEDIAWVTRRFAAAAKLAVEAGFDAVEIHGGHGYLISSFLSPHYNLREDEYGGSLENRARLLLEVIRAVRAAIGARIAIICRLDAMEYRVDDGIRPEHAEAVAELAARAGCDAISVTAYSNPTSGIGFTEGPLVHEPGAYIPFAARIRRRVAVPVIVVGRVEPERAEQGIAAGEFEFVAMGRKLLADPDLPNKLRDGDVAAIRPCIYCYVCVSQIFLNRHVCCAVNPRTGNEHESPAITPATEPLNVLVVGGGPAGLEASRVLALRGHRVTLLEKSGDLGGTARLAALAYEPNGRLVRHLVDAVTRLPVQLKLHTEASVERVRALKPDRVVVAIGARREAPAIPGRELAHVFDGNELKGLLFGDMPQATAKLGLAQRLLVTAARLTGITRNIAWLRRLSHIYMPLGREVVIIGGGLVGLEVAELLCERGRRVSVVERSAHFGAELSVVRRWRVLHGLREHGVELLANAVAQRIEADGVVCEVAGEQRRVPADNVIIAEGTRADPDFATLLREAGFTVAMAGDCEKVGYIENAIRSGARIGHSL